MIRSFLQTIFYLYLIFDFYYNGPKVTVLLFAIWLELAMVIVTFLVLKLIAGGIQSLEYLAGILVTAVPVLLILLLFVFMIPPHAEKGTTFAYLIRNTIVGVGINHLISIFYFLKNRGTESNFITNVLIKIISVPFIFLGSFLIVANLSNPNNLTAVGLIISARLIVEIVVNTKPIKKWQKIKL